MSITKTTHFLFSNFLADTDTKHQEHWLYLSHEMTCRSHITLKYFLTSHRNIGLSVSTERNHVWSFVLN